MPFGRYEESQIRELLDVLGVLDDAAPEAVAKRLEQLKRGLEPEDEFALLISWLGKCRLVHKLNQEQLPLDSTKDFRVPDLLAIFEHDGREIPVLIEVKSTDVAHPLSLEEGQLSLKAGYLGYAEAVKLPMLIAWRHRSIWTLFDMHRAEKAHLNYRIGFYRAMEENLLSVLAGDFSYRVVPGSALCVRMTKVRTRELPDEDYWGQIEETYFTNPAGERFPQIKHLDSLFFFWEHTAEDFETDGELLRRFVIDDVGRAEFASRTLGHIVRRFAAVAKEDVNWRRIVHDGSHLAHDRGRLQTLIESGSAHGVIDDVIRFKPRTAPDFL